MVKLYNDTYHLGLIKNKLLGKTIMKNAAILCVLNNLFLDESSDKPSLPRELSYVHESETEEYEGIQANEAPIKYLISKHHKGKNPVSEIIFLCSEKCLERKIPNSVLPEGMTLDDEREYISPKRFFTERIEEYCRRNNMQIPLFTAVAYSPKQPADSLDAVINLFKEDTSYSIDITGGQRDTVILLSIAAQIIKLGSRGTSVGDIVYSNFDALTIFDQKNTYGLIDLVNAISAFTDYGRADQLESFFIENDYVKQPTKELCASMKSFSDALALCQVDGIEQLAKRIQKGFSNVEEQLGRLRERYSAYTDAIEQIGKSSGVRNRSFEEAMAIVREAHPEVDFSDLDDDDLAKKLVDLRKPTMMNRSELLFLSLIPTMRERFIPETKDEASLLIEIIRWCIDHQMIQQALCIFRERISECLVRRGYFEGSLELEGESERELSDLCMNCKIENSHLSMYPDHNLFKIVQAKEPELRLVFAWYRYLHQVRNAVMHASAGENKYQYFFSCALLGKDPDCKITLQSLSEDLLDALDSIEHPESISSEEWNKARSAAYTDTNRAKNKGTYGKKKEDLQQYVKKANEATPNGNRGPVSSVDQLLNLLHQNNPKSNKYIWSMFENWCVEEQGYSLDKKSLGLSGEGTFLECLCSAYPDYFEYEKTGFGEILTVKQQKR